MPTVAEVARSATAALATQANQKLVEQFVSHRFQELAGTTALRSLRRVGELVIPAVVKAGTVTATRGSREIVGDSDAAAVWDATLIGRYFQTRSAWYRIVDVTSFPHLVLEVEYAEADQPAGAGYRVVPRYHALVQQGLQVRQLGAFGIEERHRTLKPRSMAWLDEHHPHRQYATGGPYDVVEYTTDADGTRLVEMYPYSETSLHCNYRYIAAPPTLEAEDRIPGQLDTYMLLEGVMMDLATHKMAEALTSGDQVIAGHWGNMAARYKTIYEERKLRAIQADRGMAENELWLRSGAPWRGSYAGANRDAYSQVWGFGTPLS